MAISTAAAIVGGSIVSGFLGSRASSKASEAEERSQEVATGETRRQFDLTREDFRPVIETGNVAREQLAASLGLRGQEAEADFLSSFQESKGQKFLRERGERALLRSSAAIGGLGGGNVRRALVEEGIGVASQRLSERQNRLAAISGSGQTASTNVGAFGQASAQNISNIAIQSGRSRATGILDRNQAVQQTIEGITTGLSQSGIFGRPQTDRGLI